MPHHRTQDRPDPVGVLVIRASVEDHDGPRLVVHLLEVNLPLPDRTVGTVTSASATLALVAEWLDSLGARGSDAGVTTQ